MELHKRMLAFLTRHDTKGVLLWIVGASYADMFIRNGYRKFDPEGFWSHAFLVTWGFPIWFMYFIGVLEFVAGLMLLAPKLRPVGSTVLSVVMLGAMVTRSIFGFINGIPTEDIYNFFSDMVFFASAIAMFLFYIGYGYAQRPRTSR